MIWMLMRIVGQGRCGVWLFFLAGPLSHSAEKGNRSWNHLKQQHSESALSAS